jgi:putative membrane protein
VAGVGRDEQTEAATCFHHELRAAGGGESGRWAALHQCGARNARRPKRLLESAETILGSARCDDVLREDTSSGAALHRQSESRADRRYLFSMNKETSVKLTLALGACLVLAPLATAFAAESAQDTSFVHQAAIGGMAEVQAGHLAETQAMAPAVKQFGQTMVAQHTANNQQLATLAKSKGLSVPMDLDAAHKADAMALKNTAGTSFDAAYITNQVTGHKAMAQVMETEIQKGSDPGLKAFAKKTLPVVEGHLKMAEALQAKVAR